MMCEFGVRMRREPSPLERSLLKTYDDLMAALDEAMEAKPELFSEICEALVAVVRALDKCPRRL